MGRRPGDRSIQDYAAARMTAAVETLRLAQDHPEHAGVWTGVAVRLLVPLAADPAVPSDPFEAASWEA